MEEELQVTKRVAKVALRDVTKKNTLAERLLEMLRGYKMKIRKLQDSLAEESHQRQALERLSSLWLEIKRERAVGRKGGSGKWPIPIRIVLLICELLVNDVPPSVIPNNMQVVSETVTGQAVYVESSCKTSMAW